MLTHFNLDSHNQGQKQETRSQTFKGHLINYLSVHHTG